MKFQFITNQFIAKYLFFVLVLFATQVNSVDADKIKSAAKENDNAIIFCTGSLYFVGEILNLN